MGQLSREASAAVVEHLQRRDYTAAADAPKWFDDLDRLRAKVGRLIHAGPEDIAFLPATSYALSTVLSGIDWNTGDRVVTLDPEFPNNTYGLGVLAKQGVEVVETPLSELAEKINDRTRLVAVSALNYVTGMRAPIAEMRRLAPNALLYVDATQGCGAIDLNPRELGIDVLAVHGYKWMLSPTGAGFMYVRPEVREWLEPNVIGWRSHHNWRDWSNLHHGVPEFSKTAERYEPSFPAMPLYYSMEASVDLMLELGTDVIEKRVLELADMLRARVRAMGGEVAHENSPIVCARFDGVDSSSLSAQLLERKVIVSARHGWLRVSVHFYNDESDLDQFEKAVTAIRQA